MNEDEIKYAIGETCLLIDPFDNYRSFTLYTNDPDNPAYPNDRLDVTGQTLYLVFKHNNKEIRIPEYQTFNPELDFDRTQGEVLFKITKKQATDIMSLNSRTFYITRVYETYNSTSDAPITSDEEVIYSGYWGDRNKTKETNFSSAIDDLKEEIEKKNEIIQGLTNTISELLQNYTDIQNDLKEREDAYDDLKKEFEDFRNAVEETYPGISDTFIDGANVGELIDSKTVLIDYQHADEGTQGYFEELVNNGTIM